MGYTTFYEKNIIIIPIILFCLYDFSFAEIIDGPANVREEPNRKAIFSLYDSVKVFCNPLKNNWYEISISIQMKEGDYYIDSRNREFLKKGVKLIDWWTKKEIGESLDEFQIHVSSVQSKEFDINAYTYKDNIREDSIIENAITKILQQKQKDMYLEEFQDLIENFDLSPFYCNDELSAFEIPYHWLIKSFYRMLLIFYKKRFVAFIHSREIELPKQYSSQKILRGLRMVYVEEISDNIKEKIENYYFPIIKESD